MRQTLFLIPHELAGLPIFGFGWVMLLLAVACVARLAMIWRSGIPIGQAVASEGPLWLIAAAVIGFVLPAVELTNINGEPVGTAIRGYGVMLLLGVVSASALAAYRAQRHGIDPGVIYALAPWAFLGGIGGARLFFVIQYRDRFSGDSVGQTIINMLKFTEGGLVVYGSFIGGAIAVSYYIFRHRLPWLKLGDVIVPCLFIGVFFGRIGCLMNGCCYGGRCDDHWAAIEFPPTSIVYHDQTLKTGELLGISLEAASRRITAVAAGSVADRAGIRVGQRLQMLRYAAEPAIGESLTTPAGDVRHDVLAVIDGQPFRWPPGELPPRALPVYAAQVLSSVSALALCLGLCGLSLFNFRDGVIMMIGFAGYAVVRFLLELVRVDEGGQFGTNLSISQWVSIVVFALCTLGLILIFRRAPAGQAIQSQPTTG
jgi:phosphatidylglycerol:prolipoprotein diacylglycerol transferase